MIIHEIRKATSNRNFRFIFVFFIMASFLLVQLDLRFSPIPAISSPAIFSEVSLELETSAHKKEYLEESIENYKIYLDILKAETDGIPLDTFEEKHVDEYMNLLQERGKSYLETRYTVLLYLNSEAFNISYEDYIEEVNQSLRDVSQTSSVGHTMSSYYKVLGALDIEKGDSYFLDALYSQKFSNIIILGFIIYVVNYLFFIDEDEKMDDVIKLTLKGKEKIILAKIVSSLILVLFLLLLSNLLNYSYLMHVYSIPNASHNIQSFTQYFTSPFNYTVLEFLIISQIYTILFLVLNTLIYIVLMLFLHSRFIALMIYAPLILLSYFMYYLIPVNSSFIIFKYFNLYGLGQIFESLSKFKYFTIGPFKGTLFALSFHIILFLISMMLLLILVHLVFMKSSEFHYTFKSRIPFKRNSTSLRYHEHLKIFVIEYSLLILIAIGCMSSFFVFKISTLSLSESQKGLIQYISNHGGLIDESMDEFMLKESIYWEAYETDYAKAVVEYKNETLSLEEFDTITRLYHEKSGRHRIFKQAQKIYFESDTYFIEKSGFDILFSQYSYSLDNMFAFIIIFSIVLMFSNIFIIDQRDQEYEVYELSQSGYSKIKMNKLWISLGYTILFVTVLSLTKFISISTRYELQSFKAPMSTVINQELNSYGFIKYAWLRDLEIYKYIFLVYFIRLQGAILVTLSTLYVSKFNRNRVVVILLLSMMFIFTGVLYLSGFDVFFYFTPFDMISGNMILRLGFGYVKIVAVTLINCFLFILYLLINREKE